MTTTCQPAATTTRTLTDLDKVFTPSASCLMPTYYQWPYGLDSIERYPTSSIIVITGSQGPVTSTWSFTSDFVVRGRDPSCFPSGFPTSTCYYGSVISSTIRGFVSEQSYVYSPGQCPKDYVTAATWTDDANSDVTSGICCPS